MLASRVIARSSMRGFHSSSLVRFEGPGMAASPYDTAKMKSENLSKNLRCKVIIFDVDVLVDPDAGASSPSSSLSSPPPSSSSSSPSSPSPSSSSSLSFASFASSISSFFSHSSSSSTSTSTKTIAPVSAVYDQSQEVEGVTDLKAKYMRKIQQKLGGTGIPNTQTEKRGFIPTENRSKNSDAMMLKYAQTTKEESMKASRWLLKQGMGNILDYSSGRTIQLVVLARQTTKHYTINQLQDQLDIKFSAIVEPSRIETQSLEQIFGDIERQLKVAPLDILLVSSLDKYLKAGRDRGVYTCRFREEGGLYGQFSTDYVATRPQDVQDCVDDLNGISFRNSIASSRI